jgi:predicted Holliday junction resolvase-like endonuclease
MEPFVLLLIFGLVVTLLVVLLRLPLKNSALRTELYELQQQRSARWQGLREAAWKQAQAQLTDWRDEELASLRESLKVVEEQRAHAALTRWQIDHEEDIRRDAAKRSAAVRSGQILEQFVPHFSRFPFNPKDVRFIGTPIDYLVFDGLQEGAVRQLVFLEVKSGTSALSARERAVRMAVESRCVSWMEYRIE